MIVIIKSIVEKIADAIKFSAAVWRDARHLQHEAEAKYGDTSFWA